MSKALELLGVVSPSAAAIANPKPTDPPLFKMIVPGAVAAVAGFTLFPKHPVLGFFGLEAVGLNAFRFYRNQGSDRRIATTNLGMTAAALVGSLQWKSHPVRGFVAGLAVGIIATSFVSGSNADNLFRRWGWKK